MKKILFTLMAMAGLLTIVENSQAGLGWSYDECVQHYGEPTEPNTRTDDGQIRCHFSARGYDIDAYFITNTVSRITYTLDSGFDTARVHEFLDANGPGVSGSPPRMTLITATVGTVLKMVHMLTPLAYSLMVVC